MNLKTRLYHSLFLNEKDKTLTRYGDLKTALVVLFDLELAQKKTYLDFGEDFLAGAIISLFPQHLKKNGSSLDYLFPQLSPPNDFTLSVAKQLKKTYANLSLPENTLAKTIEHKIGIDKILSFFHDYLTKQIRTQLNLPEFPTLLPLSQVTQIKITPELRTKFLTSFSEIIKIYEEQELKKALGPNITLETLNQYIISGVNEPPPYFIKLKSTLNIYQKMFQKTYFFLDNTIKQLKTNILDINEFIENVNYHETDCLLEFIVKNSRIIQPQFYGISPKKESVLSEKNSNPENNITNEEEGYYVFMLKHDKETKVLIDYNNVYFETAQQAFDYLNLLPETDEKYNYTNLVVPETQAEEFETTLINSIENP